MKIDISIVGFTDSPTEELKLSEELEYIEKLLTHSMGFMKIRDSDDGAFDTRIQSYMRSIKS